MIINFNDRAIELSSHAFVSSKMKVAVFAVALLPLISGAEEPPLLPTTEGMTWNYDLVQEKPSEGFDVTVPNAEDHLAVRYRLGSIEKIDDQDLQRLEIYRGDTLESVDFIAVEDRGITCPARADSQGAITKLVPPQIMLATPLKTGTSWDFDASIADTKVSQHYEIAGEEDVDVPAGKFHAWRIHSDQTSPAPATIDRWFVPGTGFVKVETVVKAPSGGVLQKTSMKLKEPPKITAPSEKDPTPQLEKFSAGISSERSGEFKTSFKSDTPAIYARWRG